MSRRQMARLGAVSLLLAAVQTAGFDRFLLFGAAYLAIPLFLAVAVGSRLPFTNAVITGAFIGLAWDLLSIDLFGRYALALGLAAGVSSVVSFGMPGLSSRNRLVRRGIANLLAALILIVLSALVGETLPVLDVRTLIGLVLSVLIGVAASGSVLNRIAMPRPTVWDPTPVRSTDWSDRRAGIYSVPAVVPEREAA